MGLEIRSRYVGTIGQLVEFFCGFGETGARKKCASSGEAIRKTSAPLGKDKGRLRNSKERKAIRERRKEEKKGGSEQRTRILDPIKRIPASRIKETS